MIGNGLVCQYNQVSAVFAVQYKVQVQVQVQVQGQLYRCTRVQKQRSKEAKDWLDVAGERIDRLVDSGPVDGWPSWLVLCFGLAQLSNSHYGYDLGKLWHYGAWTTECSVAL